MLGSALFSRRRIVTLYFFLTCFLSCFADAGGAADAAPEEEEESEEEEMAPAANLFGDDGDDY